MARRPSLDKSLPALWRILKRFWPWIRRERGQIVVTFAALFGGVLLSLAEPWPLKFVLDAVIPPGGAPVGSVPDWVGALEPESLLLVLALSMVVISVLASTCQYYQKVGFARIGNRVLRDVRNHVFLHMQGLSMSFHTRSRGGDLVIRATRDVAMLRDVMSTAMLPLLATTLVLLGMFTIMLAMNWSLTLMAMAMLPLFWWATSSAGRRIHRAARKQREREGAMASTASESIAAIKVVQALSLEGVFAENFASRNRQSQKEDMKTARLSAGLGRKVDVLLAVATALVVYHGTSQVMAAQMSVGDLVVFLTYLKRSFRPARDLAKYTGRIAKAVAAGERVVAILDSVPEVRDLPAAAEAPAFEGRISFEAVDFRYRPDTPVLTELDLEIPAGSTVAVLGPSGIGKSTLASLVLRLYDPTAGRVCIDGHDIRRCTLRSLRRQISVVLQDTVLFAGTLAENIAHGVPEATAGRIEAAARLAKADEFIARLPEGYDTVVGERGTTLSHGQRQRLAIARAAMRDTPILILDEPTTALDERVRADVIAALRELARGRTTLLISHELDMTTDADLIVCIENGRIAECGSPARLLAAGGHYRALLEEQGLGGGRDAV